MNRKAALDTLFSPKSIAIVGAAPANAGSVNTGQLFVDAISRFGYEGAIYPVHPRGGELEGLKIFPSLDDIPGEIDYLISCIPATGVPQLLKDCARRGVKSVVLFTAGFSEVGSDLGRRLEREVQELGRSLGILVVGPNCMGVYTPKVKLSYAPDFPKESGRVAMMCQSGGNSLYMVRSSAMRGIRVNKLISYGNAAALDESEILEYLAADEDTDFVAAYMEGVKDGRRFFETLREVTKHKPVAILRPGQTPAGRKAASSHTGSLGGEYEIWTSMVKQAGGLVADDLDHLTDLMVAFKYMKPPKGKKLIICGNGGGSGVLSTDACAVNGFMLPPLSEELRKVLLEAMGTEAGNIFTNPVDILPMLASDEEYQKLLRKLFYWEDCDFFVLHLAIRGIMLDLPVANMMFTSQMRNVIEAARQTGKPAAVVTHYMTDADSWQAALTLQKECYEAGMPSFKSVAGAVRAVGALIDYSQRRNAH